MELFPADAPTTGGSRSASVGAVVIGGAVGATARWAVGSPIDISPATWPWPTLIVNIIGCVLIGVAARRIERPSLRWDAVVTGLLGGFTTMSSFAVELNDFVDADRTALAISYGAVTLAAGAVAVTAGMNLAATTTPAREPTSESNGGATGTPDGEAKR